MVWTISAIILVNFFQSYSALISVKDILTFLLFLSLTFLGVCARAMIEIERYNKKWKDIKFFIRYSIATILAFILREFMNNTVFLEKFYAEVIILFCIFVNDIIDFVFNNKSNIILYILNSLTKGISDIKRYLVSNNKKSNNDNISSDK